MYAPVAVLVLAVLMPLAGLLVGVWLGGWRLELVRTGSMEPTYPVGSMTVVEPIDASEVRSGMALSFTDPGGSGQVVTHRVVRVISQDSGLFFETQGDANATPDPQLVPARNARGVVRWHVPYFGSAAWALRWPRAPLALVAAPGLLLAAGEWRAWRRRRSARPGIEDLQASIDWVDYELANLAGQAHPADGTDVAVAAARAACRAAVDALDAARPLVAAGAVEPGVDVGRR